MSISHPKSDGARPALLETGLDQTFIPTDTDASATSREMPQNDREDDQGKRAGNRQSVRQQSAEGSTPSPPVKRGRKLAKKKVSHVGDFELKKRLGKGGMGEVFLARQTSLDRLVALKTLSRDLAKKEDFVARFMREARSMAKLDHPNVVKVFAVDSFKGVHFAAIEYIDGKSVQDWLDHLEKFSVGDALHIALVAAEALAHAHELNMVHRDIKPDNILLTKKGVVKVADFGLAKALDEDVSMTQSGTGLGTPLYMAPEQARSAKHVDQRTDIYALGATLYHMLTGKLPFNGGTALELIMAKEKGTYPPARSLRSEVPEKLDLILDRMMAKDPNHRYADCHEVIRDLGALGLHDDRLTFIAGSQPQGSATGRPSGALSGGSGTNKPRVTLPGGSSAGSMGGGSAARQSSRIWYVQFEDSKGKMVVEKHSTGRVLKMIRSGMLTAKGRAKATADGSYMPLAQFPEFADAIEDQLARRTAAIRKEDMASLYKQVDRDEKRRYRWRWLQNLGRGLVGWASLGLLLLLIAVVVWLGINFGADAVRWGAAQFGLSAESAEAETGDAQPEG